MYNITGYSKCKCGAFTLFFANGADTSMYEETLDGLGIDLSGVEEYPTTMSCNHCVNHWGIDLCCCGSGEKVGECDCGSNESFETLGERIDTLGMFVKNIGL
ncbi:MAG: hypothetical protein J6Y37_18520 [Paludibacteraceae bacterium]|nr:hypothetical protein [Paludibacteraceae bacterium]